MKTTWFKGDLERWKNMNTEISIISEGIKVESKDVLHALNIPSWVIVRKIEWDDEYQCYILTASARWYAKIWIWTKYIVKLIFGRL